MLIRRGFRYRIYPTPDQEARLHQWQGALRVLWNLAHEQRLAMMAEEGALRRQRMVLRDQPGTLGKNTRPGAWFIPSWFPLILAAAAAAKAESTE